jgi:hypothetical protein
MQTLEIPFQPFCGTENNTEFCGTKIKANSQNSIPNHFADENPLSKILFSGAGFCCKTHFFL